MEKSAESPTPAQLSVSVVTKHKLPGTRSWAWEGVPRGVSIHCNTMLLRSQGTRNIFKGIKVLRNSVDFRINT